MKKLSFLFALLCASVMAFADDPVTGSSTDNMDGQPGFTNGYDYSFSTEGTSVTISFTEKEDYVGLVAYLWNYTNGFTETQMAVSGHTASITLTGQAVGSTLDFACKFAFSGGMSVTKRFTYTVPNSGGDPTPDPDPTPTGIDWSSIAWLGNGSGNAAYTDKYKISLGDPAPSNVVNIQTPGWPVSIAGPGIYVEYPSAAFGDCSIADDKMLKYGAGVLYYMSAFTAQETVVSMEVDGTVRTFTVYYADGTTGGGGDPTPDPAPVDPNDYTAGGHTIHLDASYVGDIYTLVITSADDMQGLGGSFWNVNGVGADMRTNTGTSSYTVSGDKKTITCQVQSTSAPNIYTPLYVLMPGEVNFGNVTLNWVDLTPINSEYCNYQDPQTLKGGKNIALTWETDGSGNVVITMQPGTGTTSCSFRNGGFEGGIGAFVVSDDDFVTTTPASDYFTAVQVYSGNTYTLTKVADLPANAKIKHVGSGHALAWVLDGNDEYCFPDFIYTYGGTCNQLDAPTNVAIDANNIITFDAVTGADSYMAYVSLGGVEKYSQAVASGDELTYTALVTGDYIVNVVASGAGKVDSDPSADVVWHLEAAPVVLGNSEYCEHVFMADDNREAAFTWETDGDGNIVITISATRGDAAATHFRGNGMALANFKVGAGKADASTYFNHACGGSNQVTLSLKNPANAPALGEKIYFNQTVEYATSLDGNAWPTLNFEWTYGTVCSGKAVSASVNNNTMGSAVVKVGEDEVTSVDEGTEVTFIATSADPALYRFVNWTKGGVEVSTSATYAMTITETTNLVANFDYVRTNYCRTEVLTNNDKTLYLSVSKVADNTYKIRIDGSAEARINGRNNFNFVVNHTTNYSNEVYDEVTGLGWKVSNEGNGYIENTFSAPDYKALTFGSHYFAIGAQGGGEFILDNNFPAVNTIAWNSTCSDAEAPVFNKAEAEVLSETSVQLKIQATDNWGGVLTYTIARAGAEPIISNHASGEEFAQDVTGLTTGTEYDFTVTVSDGVNNANTHILVTPVGDETKPVMGTASLESKTWNSAIINVAATDNIGVASFYIVELDQDFVASEGKITVTGLTQGTEYNFTIKAKDGAGNLSENSASVNFTTDAHLTAPATAAPVPTWPAAQVKSLYSDSYSLAPSAIPNYNDCWWDCPNVVESDVDGNHFLNYDLYRNGMIGVSFANISVATMEKIHIDIWSSAAGTVTFRPITTGGPNNPQTLNLVAQQWNSFDLEMSSFSGHNWADLFQYAIEFYQAGGLVGEHICVDNVFFYRETPLADSEAPTTVTASAANSFYSVKITAQAEDNSGAVNFSVKNGDTEVATGVAASGAATTITVNNLTPGTAYNFNVIASDDAGNEAAPVAVAANTLAAPAAAPVPTEDAANVMAVFSDAYTPVVTVGNYCEWWWESPTVHNVILGADDNARYYDNNHQAGGSFGWSWSADNKIDFTGFQKLHLHIYPSQSGTIEIYPVIAPEAEFHKVSQTLTAGQWNEIVLDYTDKTFAPLNQIGFVNFFDLGEFFIDNVYFYAEVPAKDVVRDGLSAGKWGTICPKQTVENVEGATFYQISYLEEQNGLPYNMVWDQISGTTLTAGQPYFFIADGTQILGNKTGAELSVAGDGVNGFYGYISSTNAAMELTHWHTDYEANEEYNTFIIYNNSVFRINQGGTMLNSERCYININSTEPRRGVVAPAPGLKRLNMSISGTNETTDIDALKVSDKPVKMIIDGQLYILRGEKLYDSTGRMVK